VIKEDAGIAGVVEFSGGDGSDDEAADDEEHVNAEGAVIEEAHQIGGGALDFGAVKMAEDDEDSRKAATDLNAGEVFRSLLRYLRQEVAPVALLYQCVGVRWWNAPQGELD
jgi:hypothetical protein